MANAPSQSMADLEYAYYTGAIAGTLAAQPVAVSGQVTVAPFNNDGASAGGTAVAAPAAGATIATLTLASGTWDVSVTTLIAGTVAALDTTNMVVKGGTTTFYNAPTSLNGSASPQPTRRFLTSGNSVTVTAVAAATAGSIYSAAISAIRVR